MVPARPHERSDLCPAPAVANATHNPPARTNDSTSDPPRLPYTPASKKKAGQCSNAHRPAKEAAQR